MATFVAHYYPDVYYYTRSSLHLVGLVCGVATISGLVAFRKKLFTAPFFVCLSIAFLHACFLFYHLLPQIPPEHADEICHYLPPVMTFLNIYFMSWNLAHNLEIYWLVGNDRSVIPKHFLLISHITITALSITTSIVRSFIASDIASPDKSFCMEIDNGLALSYFYIPVFLILIISFILWSLTVFKTCHYMRRNDVKLMFVQNLVGNLLLLSVILAELLGFALPKEFSTFRAITRTYGYSTLGILVFFGFGLTPYNFRKCKVCCSGCCKEERKASEFVDFY